MSFFRYYHVNSYYVNSITLIPSIFSFFKGKGGMGGCAPHICLSRPNSEVGANRVNFFVSFL